MTISIAQDSPSSSRRRRSGLVAAVLMLALTAWYAPAPSHAATKFKVAHDTFQGRIRVENDVLKLEFGYKGDSRTFRNQGGGNLYRYYDKRFSATRNIVRVWWGGSDRTKAFASGAGGIGSTQIYAVPRVDQVGGASYKYALADNARDAAVTARPTIRTAAAGQLEIVFDLVVSNRDWSPSYRWYSVRKVWRISPTGRISLQQQWKILKTGYFSEPATRQQITTAFTTVSRWGHDWSDSVSGKPGTNSRRNSANRWYRWTPRPSSVQECNAPDGSGGSQDAIHADYNRFSGGVGYDFWFWPDNGGRGFEGLGQYEVGFNAFGRSEGSTANEICHHNRKSIGDGADAYNLGILGWWGGDGATRDRYKVLKAGTTWTDSFQMEVRAPGAALPGTG